MSIATERTTYSIDFFTDLDTDKLVMHIYRYVSGGICSPFSQQVPCESKEQAKALAFNMGYLADGEWTDSMNGSSIPAVKMA